MEPTFSIVIPAYNRESFIERAVWSCLRQRHAALEVIVVDDASVDRTPTIVSQIHDQRLRLIVQPVNRGVSAARNLGISHARGEWIIALDSDDELTPDSLELVDAEIRRVPAEVQAIRFMCRLDDGSLSPLVPLTREVWDYEAYLKWAERVAAHGLQETMLCVRRRTFDHVRHVEGGGSTSQFGTSMSEAVYHLDFAARFLTATTPAVTRLYHSDATDQVSRPSVTRALAQAPDHVRNYQLLLDRHGAALARCAPDLHAMYVRALATHQFLAGDRIAGLKTIGRLMRARHVSFTAWAILGFGLLGRRPLAYAQAEHRRRYAYSLPVVASAKQ
jgi:glycosyltransferase involved in cell wall biosynthesis